MREPELRALKAVTRLRARRVATLSGHYGGPRQYTAYIVRRGQALPDIPNGRALVVRHFARLHADLREAIAELRRAGIQHRDLYPRNITYDGTHFNIIDLGKVTFTTRYDVQAALDEALAAVAHWAQRQPPGRRRQR